MFVYLKKNSTFAVPKRDDSLAQQVEHNTFNVGVLGSSPRRITKKPLKKRLFLWSADIRMRRVVRRRRHRRRLLSTNRGVFVDAEYSKAAFVHKKGIFCGCREKLQLPVHTEGTWCGRNIILCIFATVINYNDLTQL